TAEEIGSRTHERRMKSDTAQRSDPLPREAHPNGTTGEAHATARIGHGRVIALKADRKPFPVLLHSTAGQRPVIGADHIEDPPGGNLAFKWEQGHHCPNRGKDEPEPPVATPIHGSRQSLLFSEIGGVTSAMRAASFLFLVIPFLLSSAKRFAFS